METNNSIRTATKHITDKQIRALKADAIEHGDYSMADLCDRALATDGALATDDSVVNQDGDTVAMADWTREAARARCAEVINDVAANVLA